MISSTRYTLTVPTHDNDGVALDGLHADVRGALTGKFSGFTELSGTGHWIDTDPETVVIYVIDTDDRSARLWLAEIASFIKTAARQDAVYLTAQPISVELV